MNNVLSMNKKFLQPTFRFFLNDGKENIFHKMVWVVLGKTKKINDIYCIIYVKQQLGYDIQFHTAIKIRKGKIFLWSGWYRI